MDHKTFAEMRDQEMIRRWYEGLSRQPDVRQGKFAEQFAKWIRRPRFHEALLKKTADAHNTGGISLIQIGEFDRKYLRQYFELFACDHFSKRSVQSAFSTPQQALEFLCAQEEFDALVECLDPKDIGG